MMQRCGYCGALGHSARSCRARILARDVSTCGICGQGHASRFCRPTSRYERRRLGGLIDHLHSENVMLRAALKLEQEQNLSLGAQIALIDAGELPVEEVERLAVESRGEDPWRDQAGRPDPRHTSSGADTRCDQIDDLLAQASDRLADIQRRLPRGAQPLVVYLTEILDHLADCSELAAGASDPEPSPRELLMELSRRPGDVRDTLLTMRHIPGVSREHLVRVARFADVVEQAAHRIIGAMSDPDALPDGPAEEPGDGHGPAGFEPRH